jgi:hypothetical protein
MKSPWLRRAEPGARELMGIGNPHWSGNGACQRLATTPLPVWGEVPQYTALASAYASVPSLRLLSIDMDHLLSSLARY